MSGGIVGRWRRAEMEAFRRRMVAVLCTAFPGCEADVKVTVPNQKVGGWLVWPDFLEMEIADRLSLLRSVLEKTFTPDERRAIDLVFTFTPEEASSIREDQRMEEERAEKSRLRAKTRHPERSEGPRAGRPISPPEVLRSAQDDEFTRSGYSR